MREDPSRIDKAYSALSNSTSKNELAKSQTNLTDIVRLQGDAISGICTAIGWTLDELKYGKEKQATIQEPHKKDT
jgi:hypothetical protein